VRWHATTAAHDPATGQGATALFGNLGKDQAQRVDRLVAGSAPGRTKGRLVLSVPREPVFRSCNLVAEVGP
jgi:hypothetical protein